VNKNLIYIVILIIVTATSCITSAVSNTGEDTLRKQIRDTAGSAVLNISEWQVQNYMRPDSDNKVYGQNVIKQELLPKQIAEILKENNFEVIPSVKFRLEKPPDLLVVSTRTKIAYFDRVLVSPDLTTAEMVEIEKKVDSLSLSSLIVELGGFGAAYPAIVSPELGTKQIINAAVEEWAHQFLSFRPLGALYLLDCLGVRQSADIIIMNESLAGMMADEIGIQVYERYYQRPGQEQKKSQSSFDFYSAMRETRCNTDMLLNAGETQAAEQYMEERRIYFEQNGYRIRKLNQAYFAFHGIYGDDPGAVSPVYSELARLRKGYATLAGFVNDVSSMTDYRQLKEALPQ
jgi:hypothetical protein